jgi:hypothetical protein
MKDRIKKIAGTPEFLFVYIIAGISVVAKLFGTLPVVEVTERGTVTDSPLFFVYFLVMIAFMAGCIPLVSLWTDNVGKEE